MIVHKIGDSIKWKIKSTESDGITPIDWTGAIIEVKAVSKFTGAVLFEFSTENGDSNRYITTTNLNIGEYSVIVKDTDEFQASDYVVDFRYNLDGFKQSSKAISLKIVARIQ